MGVVAFEKVTALCMQEYFQHFKLSKMKTVAFASCKTQIRHYMWHPCYKIWAEKKGGQKPVLMIFDHLFFHRKTKGAFIREGTFIERNAIVDLKTIIIISGSTSPGTYHISR